MSVLAIPTPGALAQTPDPGEMVLALVEQGRSMIAQARTIEEHVTVHQRANAISTLTKQLGLSKELVLEAQELERHTERALGLAIRAGQERGELGRRGHRNGDDPTISSPAATAGFKHGADLVPVYALADAEPETFEEAVAEAKAEGNLSRANVIRKIKGEVPKSARPEILRGTRRLDSNRIVQGTVDSVHGIDVMFSEIDYAALDYDQLLSWVSSLADAIRSLTTLKNNLKKELTRGRE